MEQTPSPTNEHAFVGMAILGRGEVLSACRLIEPAHLQTPFLRDAYRLVRQAHAQGTWPSEASLVDRLRPAYADAQERIWACCATIGKTDDAMVFALEILRQAQIRARLEACDRYVRETMEARDDVRTMPLLRESLEQAAEIYSPPEAIEDVYSAAMEDMDRRCERYVTGGAAGVTTGFRGVDELTGGWQPGINVIGAWSSVGKTSVMVGSIVACMTARVRPRVYTIDMGPFPLTWRVAAQLGMIELSRFATGRLTNEQHGQYGRICKRMLAAGCAIDRRHSDIDSLCSSLVEYRDTYEIAFIDYAQKIGVKGNVNERERIERVLAGLAETSAAIGGKPIVLLSQLSEAPTGREMREASVCPRPNANQLRGNRYLTDFAACVILVWRAGYLRPDGQGGDEAELIVDKNQNGARGVVPVTWDAEHARFSEGTGRQGRIV